MSVYVFAQRIIQNVYENHEKLKYILYEYFIETYIFDLLMVMSTCHHFVFDVVSISSIIISTTS